MAIQELQNVINVATKIESKQQQAEACHKLGLLFNMQSKDRDPKKSLQFLQEHFDMLRTKDESDTAKDMKRIDAARVNIGIVEANKKMEDYKYLVMHNLQGLVEWKVRRDPKHF
jgi:hypothetical protein